MMSPGAFVPVTEYVTCRGPARVVYVHAEDAGVGALSDDETLLAISHSEQGDSRHPAVRVVRTEALHHVDLRTAERVLARDAIGPTEGVQKELNQVSQLTRAALAEMRAAIFELRPNGMAEEGLLAALVKHAGAISVRERLPIAVKGPEERLPLAPEAEDQLYGLVREALANAVKHANATAVAIDVSAIDHVVAIEVRDDGCGFTPADAGDRSFGLQSMHSRAVQLGGQLRITSAPNLGTAIHVKVPTVPNHP